MARISARYADILFKVFLTLVMSALMSVVITFLNLGLTPDFWEKWAIAFAAGFVASFPAILIAVPIAKRLVARLTGQNQLAKPENM